MIKTLDLSNVPTYAFGGGNDNLKMFEVVDTTAMANTSAHVKSHADYITKSHTKQWNSFWIKIL